MNLKKQVNVTFGQNPVVGGKAFLFEVAESDIPRAVYEQDVVQIAQLAGSEATTFCKTDRGELMPGSVRNQRLYDLLRTAAPNIHPDGKITFGNDEGDARDPNVHFPPIRGIAVKDLNVAEIVSGLFGERGYEIQRKYR